jgi:hypothetical protein
MKVVHLSNATINQGAGILGANVRTDFVAKRRAEDVLRKVDSNCEGGNGRFNLHSGAVLN